MRSEKYLVLQRHFNAALTHYLGHLMEGNCNNLHMFMKISVEAVVTIRIAHYRKKGKHKNSGNHGIDILSCKKREKLVYTRSQGGTVIWRDCLIHLQSGPSVLALHNSSVAEQFLSLCTFPLFEKWVFLFSSQAGDCAIPSCHQHWLRLLYWPRRNKRKAKIKATWTQFLFLILNNFDSN